MGLLLRSNNILLLKSRLTFLHVLLLIYFLGEKRKLFFEVE
jgi:hypothetical protein